MLFEACFHHMFFTQICYKICIVVGFFFLMGTNSYWGILCGLK